MSERFRQVIEEASKRVGLWPEWKKSDALKMSEQSLAMKEQRCQESAPESEDAKSAAAGE